MAWYDFLYKKVEIDADEQILQEGPARIVHGVLAVEGRLTLTSSRLVFVPQIFWFWIPVLSFDLSEVIRVEKDQRLARLVVTVGTKRYSFRLPDTTGKIQLYGASSEEPEKWAHAIEAAQSSHNDGSAI